MSDELKFKVGDKVAVYGVLAHYLFYAFDEVDRITPTGRIKLKKFSDKIYNPDGWERGGDYRCAHLKHDTPELRQAIADEQEEKELRCLPNSYSWRKLSVPQLRELKVLLNRFVEENAPT